jgi:hypothetical protein
MRFPLVLGLLAATLAQAQQSTASSQAPAPAPSSSSSAEEEVPTVIKLASQDVTIPTAQIPLTTLDGKEVRLGDYNAKVVVVSLWSTIFGNQTFLEYLEALHQSYRGRKDVVILAINVDMPKNAEDLEVIREIARQAGASYPFLVDKELKLMALVNKKLRPADMERKSFVTPNFLLFTRNFEQMERPPAPEGTTKEEVVKGLRKDVERLRLRKK